MSKIAIITDSTAYLSSETVKRYGIHVMPLKIHWKGETFRDNVDIHPESFYEDLEKTEWLPTTSQPSMQEFYNMYDQIALHADAIIVILISSGISGTVGSAMSAAQEFEKVPVEVVDSHLTSVGLALVVKKAAELIEAGMELAEVTRKAKETAEKVRLFFVVDTLKYLHKGGRIGGASRYFGTALKIKPILTLTPDGRIDALEKVRTQKKALQRLIRIAEKFAGKGKVIGGVMHASDPEVAKQVMDMVGEALDVKEIGLYELSPVIGTHVGPGAVGLALYVDEVI
jgi:fatty acid kinase fatty acid binding subunit